MDVLANWLWQGGAVAVAATLILRASRQMSATTRYRLWWIALFVVLLLPAIPWLSALALDPGIDSSDALAVSALPLALNIPSTAIGIILPAPPAWVGSLLVALWALWTIVSIGRTLTAFVALRRAKRDAGSFPDTRERNLQTWLALRAAGRPVRLVLSDDVRAAAVLGLTSPAIAVAPTALQALDDTELDQIVVHEWAHVQRRDDVARLLQRIVVAVTGLHPAVWWIDRQLSLERETACDDWAVNATGSSRSLAVCLTKLASLTGARPDAVLLPAALLPSELSTRVVRLLDSERNTSTSGTLGGQMLVATALTVIAFTVASVELVVTSTIAVDPAKYLEPALPAPIEAPAQSNVRFDAPLRAIGFTSPAHVRQAQQGQPKSGPHQHARSESPSGGTTRQPPAVGRGDIPITPAAVAPGDIVLPNHPVYGGELAPTALPGTTTPLPISAGAPTEKDGAIAPARIQTPWGAAATAGVTVGKGSQRAATSTAGFFSRLGKSIAGSF
jgi:beta-lactamase regulating signal transducer with metallopeptidase domain